MDNMAKYGFRYSMSNGEPCPNPVRRYVADGYQAKADDTTTNVDLNIGDPVKRLGDGTVALANGGDPIYGIIVGIEPYWNGSVMQPTSRLPGGTTSGGIFERQSAVLMVPAKGIYWEADVNDNTTATTEVAYRQFAGENVDHACVADLSNPSQPKANPRLAIAGHGTPTAQWRCEHLSSSLNNQDFAGANVKYVVSVNESQETPAMSPVGI